MSATDIKVKSTSALGTEITFNIANEKIQEFVDKSLREIQPTFHLDGFRRGKVPVNVIKKRIGSKLVEEEIVKVGIQNMLDVIEEKNLTPAYTPKLDWQRNEENAQISYKIEFESRPTILFKDLEKIKLTNPVIELDKEAQEKILKYFKREHATWNEVDGPIETGDKVSVASEFEVKGDSERKSQAPQHQVFDISDDEDDISEQDSIFYKSVKGLKKGDNYQFEIKVDDGDKKKVKVSISGKIEKVERPEYPEVNDEFIKGLNIKAKTTEELLKQLEEDFTAQWYQERDQVILTKAIEEWLEKNLKMDIPNKWLNGIREESAKRQEAQGDKPVDAKKLELDARKEIIREILLQEYIEDNKIEATKEEVTRAIVMESIYTQKPLDWAKNTISNKEAYHQYEQHIKKNKALDEILSKITRQEKKMSLPEFKKHLKKLNQD